MVLNLLEMPAEILEKILGYVCPKYTVYGDWVAFLDPLNPQSLCYVHSTFAQLVSPIAMKNVHIDINNVMNPCSAFPFLQNAPYGFETMKPRISYMKTLTIEGKGMCGPVDQIAATVDLATSLQQLNNGLFS